MKPYKAVIFDLDGTLLDTLEDLTSAVNQAMRECGCPEHTMEDVRGFVGNGIGLLIQRALPPEATDAFDMALQSFKRHYALHHSDATAPYAGAPELLAALRNAGLKLAVISNKNDPNVKALCEAYFPGQLDEAAGEREGIRRKPAPDSVLQVMRDFGVSPVETLYVGDSDVDVKTAQNAGIDCAAVLWGFRSAQSLREAGAQMLFDTPKALESWILSDATQP